MIILLTKNSNTLKKLIIKIKLKKCKLIENLIKTFFTKYYNDLL